MVHSATETLAGCWFSACLCKGFVLDPRHSPKEVFKGLANPGDIGGHKLWGKCTTSAECKTDISAVLAVMSGLDPHMIIELEE